MDNITRCICPLSGTYVVMLTKRQPQVSSASAIWFAAIISESLFIIFILITLKPDFRLQQLCSGSLWLIANLVWIDCKYLLTFSRSPYPQSTQSHTPQRPIFVIVSCACCLLQCCSAFLILLPIWCNRKCAVTFLKMQFCISTSSVMLIYLLGFMKMLPVVSLYKIRLSFLKVSIIPIPSIFIVHYKRASF